MMQFFLVCVFAILLFTSLHYAVVSQSKAPASNEKKYLKKAVLFFIAAYAVMIAFIVFT